MLLPSTPTLQQLLDLNFVLQPPLHRSPEPEDERRPSPPAYGLNPPNSPSSHPYLQSVPSLYPDLATQTPPPSAPSSRKASLVDTDSSIAEVGQASRNQSEIRYTFEDFFSLMKEQEDIDGQRRRGRVMNEEAQPTSPAAGSVAIAEDSEGRRRVSTIVPPTAYALHPRNSNPRSAHSHSRVPSLDYQPATTFAQRYDAINSSEESIATPADYEHVESTTASIKAWQAKTYELDALGPAVHRAFAKSSQGSESTKIRQSKTRGDRELLPILFESNSPLYFNN
jgi:hypothetical protein